MLSITPSPSIKNPCWSVHIICYAFQPLEIRAYQMLSVPAFEATSRARDVSKIGKENLHEHCKSRMTERILDWWDLNLSNESSYVHIMVVSGAWCPQKKFKIRNLKINQNIYEKMFYLCNKVLIQLSPNCTKHSHILNFTHVILFVLLLLVCMLMLMFHAVARKRW